VAAVHVKREATVDILRRGRYAFGELDIGVTMPSNTAPFRIPALPTLLLSTPLLGVLLTGCPDPNPVGSYQEYGEEGPAASAGETSGGAAGPTDKGSTQPNSARFQCTASEECVKVTGSFNYAGAQAGMNRLDFQSVTDGAPPRLAHTLELKKPGTWSIDAPKDFGTLRIVAFIDLGGDGPSKGDPGAVTELDIGAEDLLDVSLDLTDDFDIAVLSPGGGPGGMKQVMGDPAAGGDPNGGDPNGGDPNGGDPGANPDGPAGPAPGEPGGPPSLPDPAGGE